MHLTYRAIVSKPPSEKYTLSCYKTYSKILNIKLQRHSEQFITETQNEFRKGRSYTDPNIFPKLLIEYNFETRLLFIDYGKAFDNIQR